MALTGYGGLREIEKRNGRSDPATAAGNLSIRGVSKIYDPDGACVQALSRCSVEIRSGEFVAIIGPSGCGKSTLLNMIAGFDTLTEGEIYLDNALLGSHQRPPRPGPDRVVVFQNGALFPWKTVLENVMYGPVRQKVLDPSVVSR